MLVLSQGTEDGISRRTHTTLQRQELLGDTALVHLLYEELSGQETNLIRYRIAVLKSTGLVGDVALHDASNLLLGDADIRLTDAVTYMFDGDSLTVRGIQRLIYVVNILCIGVMEAVEFQDNVLGQTGSCRRNTTSSRQIDVIVVAHLFDVAHLENGPIYIAIKSIAQLLCHVAQMKVVIRNLTHVHVLAEIGVGGVRGTIEDSLCVCQVTVRALSCGGTCEDSHLKLAASLMLSHSDLC